MLPILNKSRAEFKEIERQKAENLEHSRILREKQLQLSDVVLSRFQLIVSDLDLMKAALGLIPTPATLCSQSATKALWNATPRVILDFAWRRAEPVFHDIQEEAKNELDVEILGFA
ncbi:hypothetical protein KIN20_010901 [Parelaphostrongylus tenuis]|uniref:Uncharacterized protein n=1 Tax=Parelaphostrongylus tenuis TaxID=148309 RepID=A0AAD5QPG9_PARTN|nr:hypothetical protein KIN20_010901 [Parelaphostrongylus tenuis]